MPEEKNRYIKQFQNCLKNPPQEFSAEDLSREGKKENEKKSGARLNLSLLPSAS